MNQTLDEQDMLRKYLLHGLAGAEEEQVEVRLLTDKEFSRRVAMAQDDLIDDYAAGRLSGPELESFHEHFVATPARAHKLTFAAALHRYLSEHEPAVEAGLFEKARAFFRASPLRAALSLAVSVVILGAVLFPALRLAGFRLGRGPDLAQEFARVNAARGAAPASLQELQRSSADTQALTLRENLVREGGGPRRVEITRGVTLVRLLLEVTSGPSQSYRAVLQTAGGEPLASADNVKALDEGGARFVVVYVPAEFLNRDAYQIRLSGVGGDGRATDLGLYPFEVATR